MSDKLHAVTVSNGVATCPICARSVTIRRQSDRFYCEHRCPHFRHAVEYERVYGVFSHHAPPSRQMIFSAARV
jgi:hypothetical protein